jgi:hypothetical protein
MSVFLHFKDILTYGCRIMYINCDFKFLLNTLIEQNRGNRQTETGFVLRSVFQFIISLIAFGGMLAMGYLLLMFSCVLTDSCYYYYGGV